MILDSRIQNLENICNCFSNLNEIKENYVNTQGYFAWDLEDFNNLDNCAYQKLVDVIDSDEPFVSDEHYDEPLCYRFFLSEQFVNFPFQCDEIIGEILNCEISDTTCTVTVKPTEKFLNYLRKYYAG